MNEIALANIANQDSKIIEGHLGAPIWFAIELRLN